VGEEGFTAAVAADFMEVGEEGFTAAVAADFMEVAEEGFTAVEVSTAEATLVTASDTPSVDIVAAATTAVTVAMAGVAHATAGAGGATVGASDIGVTATDGAGDGDLASGGRIGVGDIRMATATAHGITRLTRMILTPTTVLQTIRRTIRILTMGTTILRRQIPAGGHGPRPTRTDRQDPGDPRYREAQPTRPMQTATSRPLHRVRRFFPLTG
jgi:hypothetical protein